MIDKLRPRSLYDYVAALSLFLVVAGGTAYAAATIGSAEIVDNSVASVDLKDGETKAADLANGAVTNNKLASNAVVSGKVLDGTIAGADVNESTLNVTASGVVNESLTGHDIQDDTIGGADVNESLLDPMTSDQIAEESLTGHDIQDNTIGGADVNESLLDDVPYSPAYASHDPADFDLPHNGSYAQVIYTGDGNHGDPLVHVRVPGLVMASANLTFFNPYGGDTPRVSCELGLVTPNGPRTPIGLPAFATLTSGDIATIPLSGALRVTQPGDYFVNVVCKDDGSSSSSFSGRFWQGNLIAWAT